MSTCLLCEEESNLVKSHIIPDFLYKNVKDKHGKIVEKSLQKDTAKFLNTGLFDRNILCAKCDNERLGSNLEGYVSGVLENKIYPKITNVDRQFGMKEIHEELFHDIDYKKMKLFLLSVMWRCHVTKLEFFNQVDIEGLEPIVRKMLIEDDPGDENTFQISMISILDVTGNPIPLILTPEVRKFENLHICRFLMGGIVYFINLGGRELLKYRQYTLKKSNQLLLPTFSGMSSNSELRSLGIPQFEADFFTLRIFAVKGTLITMAKEGHFDVIVDLRCCGGKQKIHSQQIEREFGEIEDTKSLYLGRHQKERLGKIKYKSIPIKSKIRKEIILINAYVKINNGNRRPFDLNAFRDCLRVINMDFKGLTIGINNIWAGYIGWDFDHNKVITIIDQELKNCRVKVVSPLQDS